MTHDHIIKRITARYKMTTIECIRDIFSILHDGTISEWNGDKSLLTLTIDCEYLAQRIDPSFNKFYVELTDLELSLSTWPNPFDLPVKTLTDLAYIFEAELEILSADIKGGNVIVACSQLDKTFDYCGGVLSIHSRTIQLYDQNWSELTVDRLDKICQSYWNGK